MITSDDLFTDEFDQPDLETIVENEGREDEENQDPNLQGDEDVDGNNDNDEDKDGDGGEKKAVKPKRVVRNPQPKLNEDSLRGKRGLTALEPHFEKVRFKGKGYEEQNLNTIMKTYEYWCHRLFPKFPFDACIEKIEKLGSKKGVKAYVRKIRMGIDDHPMEIVVPEGVDEPVEEEQVQDRTEQDERFDSLFDGNRHANTDKPPALTDADMERIRINKEKATKLREERLKKAREAAEAKLGESSRLIDGDSTVFHTSQEAGPSNIGDSTVFHNSQEAGPSRPRRVSTSDEEDVDTTFRKISSARGFEDSEPSRSKERSEKPRFRSRIESSSDEEEVGTRSGGLKIDIVAEVHSSEGKQKFESRNGRKLSSDEDVEGIAKTSSPTSDVGTAVEKNRRLDGASDSEVSEAESVVMSRRTAVSNRKTARVVDSDEDSDEPETQSSRLKSGVTADLGEDSSMSATSNNELTIDEASNALSETAVSDKEPVLLDEDSTTTEKGPVVLNGKSADCDEESAMLATSNNEVTLDEASKAVSHKKLVLLDEDSAKSGISPVVSNVEPFLPNGRLDISEDCPMSEVDSIPNGKSASQNEDSVGLVLSNRKAATVLDDDSVMTSEEFVASEFGQQDQLSVNPEGGDTLLSVKAININNQSLPQTPEEPMDVE